MAGPNRHREDGALRLALARTLPGGQLAAAQPLLDDLGALAGAELDRLAAVADRNPPVLRPFDRDGERVDEVEHHAAYRELERLAFERFALAAGCHPPVVKYALTYLFALAEFGVLCPVNMTDSLATVLRRFGAPGLRERYLPRLTAPDIGRLWQGAMFLTERAGGSDVGAT